MLLQDSQGTSPNFSKNEYCINIPLFLRENMKGIYNQYHNATQEEAVFFFKC